MKYNTQMRLASNLKRLRVSYGFSQKELAERLQIDRSLFALYESGKRCPDPELLYDVARIFGIRMEILLDSDPDSVASQADCSNLCGDEDLRLLSIYRRLSPFSKGLLMERAEWLEMTDRTRLEQKKACRCMKQKG
ncbi:MAG: helix-turn-helix domain-containing protein [Anaerovoracaceae bacterium]